MLGRAIQGFRPPPTSWGGPHSLRSAPLLSLTGPALQGSMVIVAHRYEITKSIGDNFSYFLVSEFLTIYSCSEVVTLALARHVTIRMRIVQKWNGWMVIF